MYAVRLFAVRIFANLTMKFIWSLILFYSIFLIVMSSNLIHKEYFASDPFADRITHIDLQIDSFSSHELFVDGPDGFPILIFSDNADDHDMDSEISIYSFKAKQEVFKLCLNNGDNSQVDEDVKNACDNKSDYWTFHDYTLVGFADVASQDFLKFNNSSPMALYIVEGPQHSLDCLQDNTAEYFIDYAIQRMFFYLPLIVFTFVSLVVMKSRIQETNQSEIADV